MHRGTSPAHSRSPTRPELKIGTDLTDKATKVERLRRHFAVRPAFPAILSSARAG
jgi:hypothetical protein